MPDNALFNPRVHLCVDDLHYIRLDSHHHREVHISTTIALGANNQQLCPVAAILDFLPVRGNTLGALLINSDGTIRSLSARSNRHYTSQVSMNVTLMVIASE